MRHAFARVVGAMLLVASVSAPAVARAQTAPVVADLIKDIDGVEKKLVALAKAIPVDKYTWRPGNGVRSVSEVFMHLSSDNYLMPALGGTPIPAATKLDMKDFKTFGTYEKQTVTQAQVAADLEKSFAHLKAAMQKQTAADLTTQVDMFGQKSTKQAMWIGATTHLHEHLGQLIAYARTNGVTPPWSK